MKSIPQKNLDFSVLIPTFNRSSFVKLSIESVLNQKKVSFEIIVSDDGSTDNTTEIVKAFKDKRIKYFRNKKRLGTSLNFQKSFLKSNGDYIFTLGDDDFILDENTLSEILKIMKKYKLGMGRIGTITYKDSPKNPYQISFFNDKLMIHKPNKDSNVLCKSINFGLGCFAGLVFNNLYLNRDKLKMDHVCYRDHMCQCYHPVAYDLIQKHGLAYIPNHFIVSRLSLQMIPRYFNIKKHGRLFIEEPIVLAKDFLDNQQYEEFKKEYLRSQIPLLPNIKLFSDNGNYIKVILGLIRIDKSLLVNFQFIILTLLGFLPKFSIKVLRNLMIYYSIRKTNKTVKKYNYSQKIEKLDYLSQI